jgi:hypothetical protein
MPDVLVDFQGLRLAIEGEFASPQAEENASKSALGRVEDGIAHIGIAVVYPQSLKALSTDAHELKSALSKSLLHFAVITEQEASQPELPFPFPLTKRKEPASFATGDIDALGDALRRSYDQLIRDEVLERAVNHLQEGINVFINCLIRQPATTGRFASTLGIRELPNPKKARADNPTE